MTKVAPSSVPSGRRRRSFDPETLLAQHDAMIDRYSSFAEFWPFYLREHSRPATRALHYVGTTLVVALAILLVLTGNWLLLAAMPLAGYFFAWAAHFTIEHNRPATFKYPLWSLGADFKMWALAIAGRLGPELERAGVPKRPQ